MVAGIDEESRVYSVGGVELIWSDLFIYFEYEKKKKRLDKTWAWMDDCGKGGRVRL